MYIDVDELIASFAHKTMVQLSNDDPMALDPDYNVLGLAVRLANERVDAALRSRYQLPLAQVPTLVSQYALTLARHWLYARRPETKMPETVKETYTQAVRELEQIALGKLHLGVALLPIGGEPPERDDYPDDNEYEVRASARIDTDGY